MCIKGMTCISDRSEALGIYTSSPQAIWVAREVIDDSLWGQDVQRGMCGVGVYPEPVCKVSKKYWIVQ